MKHHMRAWPLCTVLVASVLGQVVLPGVLLARGLQLSGSSDPWLCAGQGATLNGQPIHVSQASELKSSLLVTGFPYDRFTNPDNNLAIFSRLAVQARGMRRLGSAALDLCFLAAGRVDGYWEIRLEPWDLAAGMLIAREAGAIVTKRDGDYEMLTKPCSVVAANPVLHAKLLKAVMGIN